MNTNNTSGRNMAVFIGAYLVVKSIVNMILGDSFGNIIYALFEAFMLYTGLQYVNYVIAGLAGLVVLMNLKNNLSDIGSNWLYLIEGVVDIIAAVLLVTVDDIKKHFTNKWTEIGKKQG